MEDGLDWIWKPSKIKDSQQHEYFVSEKIERKSDEDTVSYYYDPLLVFRAQSCPVLRRLTVTVRCSAVQCGSGRYKSKQHFWQKVKRVLNFSHRYRDVTWPGPMTWLESRTVAVAAATAAAGQLSSEEEEDVGRERGVPGDGHYDQRPWHLQRNRTWTGREKGWAVGGQPRNGDGGSQRRREKKTKCFTW